MLSQASTSLARPAGRAVRAPGQLYTPDERARRDATVWTLVQGILAPVQALVCIVSTLLVVRFLITGAGEGVAIASILLKTALLYAIMITGSIWEKVVFGRWLFAEPFWWEDAVSFVVLALHTLYVAAFLLGWWDEPTRMAIALIAYAAYAINATQFLLKLRQARRDERRADAGTRAAAP